MKIFMAAMMILTMLGCFYHPLGISDEQWGNMTLEEKQEAYKREQQLEEKRLELRAKAQALEKEKAEQRKQENFMPSDSGAMIHHRGGIIGGEGRNAPQMLIVSLGRFAWVDRIDFYAHDNVNQRCEGRLNIKADHYVIARGLDIRKRGKKYSYFVGKKCRNIIFEAAANDEVSISDIDIFGSGTGTQIFLIRE